MHTIKVNLKKRSYNIIIGANILKSLGRHIAKLRIGSDAYIITNAYLKRKYGGKLNKALKKARLNLKFRLVPDSEKSKSIETVSSIIRDITRYDKKRRVFIIAFGGGVIGDLSGFAASVYKRGIPYIQVPTTILAQVDSGIGGKTAVDLSEGKNLVGAFYQPRLVYSDVSLLNTLSPRQVRSGLAEVIKYGIIKDPRLFAYLEKNLKQILALKPAALGFIIRRSSHIKAKIVEKDEREEKGLRTILNFGHTLGHAIEAACGYNGYNHGEAVSLGMLAAVAISKKLKVINNAASARIESLIKKAGLPVKIEKIPASRIIKSYYHDKKFSGGKNKFVLTAGLGKTKIAENIPLELIKEALTSRLKD